MQPRNYDAWKKFIETQDLSPETYLTIPDEMWNFSKVTLATFFYLF
jgi:hypothetical protein